MSSMRIQRKLAVAAWENDLTVITDILQSIEDGGGVAHGGEASMAKGATHLAGAAQQPDFGPLHCAASMGNVEMLHSILAANVCDVDAIDKDGNTALMWAIAHSCNNNGETTSPASSFDDVSDLAKRNEMELVEALVDSGANVNKPNFEGETPLFAAVKLGCAEKVAFLLENGADPNVKDINGATCLHHAATLGLDNIVALLLRNGAFLNQQDEWDECALHWAVREGGESAMRIVKLLSAHGAVLDIYNEDGETPLDLAMDIGDERMVQLLLSLGALGSRFDSMTLDGDDDVARRSSAIAADQHQQAASFPELKATPGLLAWSAEASQVARACEQSLTHLVA
jgi:ankyrin repeat protein